MKKVRPCTFFIPEFCLGKTLKAIITAIRGGEREKNTAGVSDGQGRFILKFLYADIKDKKELCIKVLRDTYELRKPEYVVIKHSDSGSQYTSMVYKIELARHHALQSMSGVGKCSDNARMESFFATLKKESFTGLIRQN